MSQYPKVGILAPIEFNCPPEGYGPWELVSYNLAEALVQLGVDVTLYATKRAKTSAKLEYLWDRPLHHSQAVNSSSMTSLHIIDALKKTQSVDIIHNHLNIHPVLYSELISTPMITTLHGAASEKDNHAYYKYLETKNYVSVSDAERTFYPSLNYVDTIYNGVDFSRYALKNNQNEYLIFSGRIVKDKGILSAIEIAQKTKIPLQIAGIITDQDFYDTQVKPALDDDIQYVGNLDYPQLAQLFSSALALVAMVEWNDPCPLSVLDALASGVPVIGSTMGSLPEVVHNPHLGIIVKNPEGAISRMGEIYAIDPVKCRQSAQELFSREVMAKRYLENYMKLV